MNVFVLNILLVNLSEPHILICNYKSHFELRFPHCGPITLAKFSGHNVLFLRFPFILDSSKSSWNRGWEQCRTTLPSSTHTHQNPGHYSTADIPAALKVRAGGSISCSAWWCLVSWHPPRARPFFRSILWGVHCRPNASVILTGLASSVVRVSMEALLWLLLCVCVCVQCKCDSRAPYAYYVWEPKRPGETQEGKNERKGEGEP